MAVVPVQLVGAISWRGTPGGESMKICNHTYAADYRNRPLALGQQCPYAQLYARVQSTREPTEGHTAVFPIDDKGACIFHSRDLAWKRQNNFPGNFLQLVQLLDEHDPERYYDFAEFMFLGSDIITKSGAERYQLRMTDLVFHKQAYFTGAQFLDLFALERVDFKDGASFDQAIFHHDLSFENSRARGLDFTRAKFTDAVSFKGVELLSFTFFSNATFTATSDSALIHFKDSRFLGITDFSAADFTLGDQSAVCFQDVQFEDFADFRNTHFNCQVDFSDVSFADMTEFIDTSFDMVRSTARYRGTAVEFNRITLASEAVLSFISTDPHHKMFNHDVQISFKEDSTGTVRFENVNFNLFTPSSKERLMQLAKLGRVEIGSGCIKYRFQTAVETIGVSEGNTALILELCQTFTTYFTASNGLNLGFEIVERDKASVSFFYFTDEGISEEIFRERLAKTKQNLWQLLSVGSEEELLVFEEPTGGTISIGKESAVINAIDAISALLGTFFRVGARIAHGRWTEADTAALLNAIPLNQQVARNRAAALHQRLIDKYTGVRLFDLSGELNNRLFLEGKLEALSQTVHLLAGKGDKYVMGDHYEVKGNDMGGLAVGPNAHAHDITQKKLVKEVEKTIDWSQMAEGLARLRQAMSREATETPQYIALGEITKAEQAAIGRDATLLVESLKHAGGWAIEIATKIGVSLPRGESTMTNKIKILFLAANPTDVSVLRLGEEVRQIDEKIVLGSDRDDFELIQQHALRVGDLQRVLLRFKPHIVHFSGHGSAEEEIVLEDNLGKSRAVNKADLTELFEILQDNVRVVVLNACFSRAQAEALNGTIDYTIGMKKTVGDKTAIAFAGAFYQALAFGRTVNEAFRLAKLEPGLLGLAGADVPELFVREGAEGRGPLIDPTKRS